MSSGHKTGSMLNEKRADGYQRVTTMEGEQDQHKAQ